MCLRPVPWCTGMGNYSLRPVLWCTGVENPVPPPGADVPQGGDRVPPRYAEDRRGGAPVPPACAASPPPRAFPPHSVDVHRGRGLYLAACVDEHKDGDMSPCADVHRRGAHTLRPVLVCSVV